MGARRGCRIFFDDDEKVTQKKIMRAVTDSGPTEMNQVKPDAIQNLFDIMALVSDQSPLWNTFDTLYNNCEIRYGDFKKQLASDVRDFIAPIREKILKTLKPIKTYLGSRG